MKMVQLILLVLVTELPEYIQTPRLKNLVLLQGLNHVFVSLLGGLLCEKNNHYLRWSIDNLANYLVCAENCR